MISARLQGGLGNQMFQIAAASALAWRNDDEAVFDFDSCYTPLQGFKSVRYQDNIFQKIKNDKIDADYFWNEPDHTYTEIPYRKNLLLGGYFQSEKYFKDFKSRIQDLFVLRDFSSEVSGLTSVHIRRGDYLNNPDIFAIPSLEYYLLAMSEIGGKFIVVSDDIEWCKQNIIGDNIFYSDLKDDILDISLMASCDNNIICNSTYSWWAAWLNRNKDKKIIAPEVWFGPSGPNYKDIVPENWVKL